MRIDIWSDVVCPWCYLGAHRLELALDQVGRDDIEVRWHAFQLDPSAGPEAKPLRGALEAKYGPGTFDSMTGRLVDLGQAEGLDYHFDRALAINTADAHRLIAWSGDLEDDTAQDALVQRLFRGYFTDGENLSDRGALLNAVTEAGLDVDEAAQVLDSDRYVAQITDDQREAGELGITGVPAFVIDQKYLIPGAQDVDRIVAMLEQVRGEKTAAR
ncbi:DsbA family oxidoreductase [soil metagenome]